MENSKIKGSKQNFSDIFGSLFSLGPLPLGVKWALKLGHNVFLMEFKSKQMHIYLLKIENFDIKEKKNLLQLFWGPYFNWAPSNWRVWRAVCTAQGPV